MARVKLDGIVAAAASGDRRVALEALRDHLAAELESTPPGVAIAPIAKELRAVIEELDSLPVREESKVDDLASRRAARRSAARGAAAEGM